MNDLTPKALDAITLDESLKRYLDGGAALVTASKRLTRELRQQYNQSQLDAGLSAWESPTILPFDAWIAEIRHQLTEHASTDSNRNENFPLVLNDLQSRSVWSQVIRKDIRDNEKLTEPLWNIESTVNTAVDAWRICCQWDISIDACGKSYLADHRSFAKWANNYQQTCTSNNWIDPYQLTDTITQQIKPLENFELPDVVFLGFDSFNQPQSRLIQCLTNNRVTVTQYQLEKRPAAQVDYLQYQDEASQWRCAANWAREKLEKNPQARLGIVAPDLRSSRSMIDQTFSEQLSPDYLNDPGSVAPRPFHISLGKSLGSFPVVKSGLILLSAYTARPLPYSTISNIIASPFIAGATSEANARFNLENWCRDKLPYQLSLGDLHTTLSQWESVPEAPQFFKILDGIQGSLVSVDKNQSHGFQVEGFLDWLKLFGWPGEQGLNSEEYQAAENFKAEIYALGSLDLVGDNRSKAETYSILARHVLDQPFETESAEVNIDVLGLFEAAGLEFDAIWFGNLNEQDWPLTLHRNPLIPARLQQQSDYYRASIDSNSQYAREQLNRLACQCDEIVFSRPCFDKDVELHPSPLFVSPGEFQGKIESAPSTLFEFYQSHKPELEIITDEQGLPLTDISVRGGTSLIENQSACPFRAYAIHRLGGRDSDPNQPGLDARDRGSLVHGLLESIWAELESSENLRDLPEEQLKTMLVEKIRFRSKKFFYKSGVGNAFFEVQQKWLEQLLLEWLDVEKNRAQNFKVVSLEKQQQLSIGDLTLNFKIDRIDQLADGTLSLTDYKTGKAHSISYWLGDRPQSPQLPLYALAEHSTHGKDSESGISALVFGQVRLGESEFTGVTANQDFMAEDYPGKQVPKLEKARLEDSLKSWPELLNYWSNQLTALAQDFASGKAMVSPRSVDVCEHCELHGFCRINQGINKS